MGTLTRSQHKTLFLLFLLIIPAIFQGAFAQTTVVSVIASGTTSWVVPAGVTSITVECWGGGGAGGGTTADTKKGGGGGAGGTYASSVLTVSSSQSYTVIVGAGATGGQAAGSAGGASSVSGTGGTVTAQGGAGGAAPNNATVSGGAGSIASSAGTTKTAGTNGGNGTTTASGAGGAGANGGGSGGTGPGTGGGDGVAGTAPGGGGSGAFVNNATNRSGGSGGTGKVKITYCIPPTVSAGSDVTTCGSAQIGEASSGAITSILSQNFNSGIGSWTTQNTSTGGTPANVNWNVSASPTSGVTTGSSFIMSYSGLGGNGNSGNTMLQSPAFSTMGFSTLSLTFKQYFSATSDTPPTFNDMTNIEVSTDASTWTTVTSSTTSAGSASSFAAATVNLNTYINHPVLYLRFRYQFSWDNLWAVDDIVIGGQNLSYFWTGPAGATFSASNTVSNPTVNMPGIYTITASNGGCTATDDVLVTIATGTVNALLPSSAASSDYLWMGLTNTNWTTATNWYIYNGTSNLFEPTAVLPAASNKVYILGSSGTGSCVSATNNPNVNNSGYAKSVFIGSGAQLFVAASQALEVNGDWTNNGTFNEDATGTVNFTGSTAQSIGGSSTISFTNVTVNKSANSITLSKPVTVSGTLTMTTGNIITAASTLLTIGTSAGAPGSLAWTSGTVVGPLKRFYSGTASSTPASGIFPVGNATYNRYAKVNFASDPGTGGSITAEYMPGACPIGYTGLAATINGQLISNYENEGYWSIAPSGGNLNTTAYNLVLRGNMLTVVNNLGHLRIIKSTGHTAWNDNVPGDGNHVAASGTTSDFTIGANGMLGFSWFDIGSDNANPLPVDLTSFAANCNGKGEVELKWSTGSEQNSHQFIVKKSRDMQVWSSVSERDAAGYANFKTYYSAVDPNPFGGVFYYRLTMTDYNGIEKNYDPISISCVEEETAPNSMIVYPNPAKPDFTVEISSDENVSNVQIQVTDLSGKMIAVRSVSLYEGKNQVLFDGMDLRAGTYIVQLISGDRKVRPVKVLVMN